MSIVDQIKNSVKQSGANKSKFVFIRDGEKRRFRFLTPMNDGLVIKFHDSYQAGINVPCQEHYGKVCEYCDDEDLRTREIYAWSVWDYDAAEVKIFMFAVNQCTPVAGLAAIYEQYGSITDRDLIVSVSGKQMAKTFTVLPGDKNKFRNTKAKPMSTKAILSYVKKAYPLPDNSTSRSVNDEQDEWEFMSAKELYDECKEKGIECEIKKPKGVYIDLLKEHAQSEDWGEDDEDETNEGEIVFDENMSAKKLYTLCVENGIETETRKSKEHYINLIEEHNKSADDDEWDESDDEWDEDESGEEDEWDE